MSTPRPSSHRRPVLLVLVAGVEEGVQQSARAVGGYALVHARLLELLPDLYCLVHRGLALLLVIPFDVFGPLRLDCDWVNESHVHERKRGEACRA